MTFWSWLVAQRYRQDPVGDVARDARQDPTWPRRASGYDTLEAYLEDHGATEARLDAFDQAHREWHRSAHGH